ncbi:MAG: YidC/Oxa1 family membrane protein insertase [Gemmatirosa sp.]|nr:YidC/Oxa1 family membrane protein insertase [Gemmatirosa sp.]
MWSGFVELIRAAIFAAAHLCAGSLGGGIVCVSLAVRLALLPLTLRLARQARDDQARLAELRPALEALRQRHAADPARLLRETQALHAAHGIHPLRPTGLVGLAVQLPVLGALFSAVRAGLGARVRFLWIAELRRPDPLLLVAVALLAVLAPLVGPAPANGGTAPRIALMITAALATLAFLWSASSAVALSAGAGALVSALQSWLVGRDRPRPEARA